MRVEPIAANQNRRIVAGLPFVQALARRMAANREEGGDLRATLRYRPVTIGHVWPVYNIKHQGIEAVSYRIAFANGLSATAVWLRAIATPPGARATIVLDDDGKSAAAAPVSDRVNRRDNVFAIDLFLDGDAAPQKPGPSHYAQMFTALGDRPLALQAAQLTALAGWIRQLSGASEVRVETSGVRTEMAALAAAALSPGLFSEAVVRQGVASLKQFLDAPLDYTKTPELFCLDLYKHFDVPSIAALARPTRIRIEDVH